MLEDERTVENRARAAISSATSSIMDLWMKRWLSEFRKNPDLKGQPDLSDFVSRGLEMILDEVRVTIHHKTEEIASTIKRAAITARAEKAMMETFNQK